MLKSFSRSSSSLSLKVVRMASVVERWDFVSLHGFSVAACCAFLTFVSSRVRSFCFCWDLSYAYLFDSNLAFSRMHSKRAWWPTVILEWKRS